MIWNILGAAFLLILPFTAAVTDKRSMTCRSDQWQCRDGSCISFDGRCDGAVDCKDGSDETHPLCRNIPCQGNLFRCTYGACVDGTAPCDGIQNCADNSDELLSRCRNETKIDRGKFLCDNGHQIPITDLCDGAPDCVDGSDETLRNCGGLTCDPYLFQCAYGACVDHGAECDETQHCHDNSDESDELCNRSTENISQRPNPTNESDDCIIPPYPENGKYELIGESNSRGIPGERYRSYNLTVICDEGYAVEGPNYAVCMLGYLFHNVSKCIRYCELKEHPSVVYTCVQGKGDALIRYPCKQREFPGTKVEPKCRTPNYRGSPSHMTCNDDGNWDSIAKCTPECGKITPDGQPYVIGGERAKHGELPWHAGIYRKTSEPYEQICGGSLATTTTIITAAHCFWDDSDMKKRPASKYAVALGKVFRPWDDEHDEMEQKSDVSEIHIPEGFRGRAINYDEDIAILVLEKEIVLQTFIRPVCVDFGRELVDLQLQLGNMGKIAGWGRTTADGYSGRVSQVLQVVELPFVPRGQCIDESPRNYVEHLTGDKFCAGYLNGTAALCQGDSGGGLSFPERERGVERYYLRGVVSTAPRNDQDCDPNARTTFTAIDKHQTFINKYINFNV